MKRNLGLAIVVGIFLFAFSAMGYGETVFIGYTGPLSGGAAKYGNNCLTGLKMAAEDINAAGGVKVAGKSYQFKIVSFDDRYKPADTVANARRMIVRNKPPVIFCPHSGGILGMMKFNEKEGFLIGGYTTYPAIVKLGNKLIFRMPPAMEMYIKGFSKKAMAHGWKKAAMILGTHTYAKTWGELFIEHWKKIGGEITIDAPTNYRTTTDFYPYLTKALATKPDVILIGGPSEPTAILVKQARELGFKGGFILIEQAKLDEMAKVVTMEQLEGCIGATPFKWRPLPMAKEFDKMYKKKFGADAISTFEAACNYEVLHVVARAMEKAGTVTDPPKIRAALKDVLPVKQAMTMRNGIADDGSLLGPTWGTEVINGKFAPPFELKWER